MARDYQINGEALVRVKFPPNVNSTSYELFALGPENDIDLGLATGPITVAPEFYHKDIYADGFGPRAPAEIAQQLATCKIRMNLVHYDPYVLEVCLSESLGGQGPASMGLVGGEADRTAFPGGVMSPAQRLMWNRASLEVFYNRVAMGNGMHYQSLWFAAPQQSGTGKQAILDANGTLIQDGLPWRFPTAYLSQPPMSIPIGTEKSMVALEWRAVACPQASELVTTTPTENVNPSTRVLDPNSVAPGSCATTSKNAVLWDHGFLRSGG